MPPQTGTGNNPVTGSPVRPQLNRKMTIIKQPKEGQCDPEKIKQAKLLAEKAIKVNKEC